MKEIDGAAALSKLKSNEHVRPLFANVGKLQLAYEACQGNGVSLYVSEDCLFHGVVPGADAAKDSEASV